MDILNDPALEDLSSPMGFLLAVKNTMRLKKGGLLFGGVPCSSLFGPNILCDMFWNESYCGEVFGK